MRIRPVSELINQKESGWPLILQWKREARNQIKILPRNSVQAEQALYYTQVTTRSPMGAIIFETGGILVDGGWIRILGSGSSQLKRTLPEWNLGKSFNQFGEAPRFLLIADDAVGGFFALNGGGLDGANLGKVFYFSPDTLSWENLDLTYSQFIEFCFSGNLNEFYKGLRWKSWQEDVKSLSGDEVFIFYPYLFTKEGKEIEKVSRSTAPIQEVWQFSMDLKQKTL